MTSVALIITILLFIVLILILFRPRNRLPLPPGPKPLPLIGNLHQAPREQAWRQFHEWTKQYGPIFKLQFGKDTIIVLGSYQAAHVLLDQRSANFSSRPYIPMAGVNLYKGMHILLRPYDERYRLHQRMESPVLSRAASQEYTPIQDLESCQLIKELLENEDFPFLLHRFAASTAYSLMYGFRIETGHEIEMKKAHQVQENFVVCAKQGDWLVDAVPILNLLPVWLAPWKSLADKFFQFESSLHKSNVRRAFASPAWNCAKHLFASKEARLMDELEFSYDTGVLCDAALDTTGQTLEFFVLAALKYPGEVTKVQHELDVVVGRDRLPGYKDIANLPLTAAFINEVLRWRPIVIGGMAHSNLEEDMYMGYRIPKGSIVLGSHWSIHMDEMVYGDPRIFRPQRWIEDPKLPNVAFGFGRRVCTGQHIARLSLYFAISRVLWAFSIRPAIDNAGMEIEVDDMAFTDYFVVRPQTFKARFEPRDSQVLNVVESKWQSTEKDVGVLLNSIETQRLKFSK